MTKTYDRFLDDSNWVSSNEEDTISNVESSSYFGGNAVSLTKTIGSKDTKLAAIERYDNVINMKHANKAIVGLYPKNSHTLKKIDSITLMLDESTDGLVDQHDEQSFSAGYHTTYGPYYGWEFVTSDGDASDYVVVSAGNYTKILNLSMKDSTHYFRYRPKSKQSEIDSVIQLSTTITLLEGSSTQIILANGDNDKRVKFDLTFDSITTHNTTRAFNTASYTNMNYHISVKLYKDKYWLYIRKVYGTDEIFTFSGDAEDYQTFTEVCLGSVDEDGSGSQEVHIYYSSVYINKIGMADDVWYYSDLVEKDPIANTTPFTGSAQLIASGVTDNNDSVYISNDNIAYKYMYSWIPSEDYEGKTYALEVDLKLSSGIVDDTTLMDIHCGDNIIQAYINDDHIKLSLTGADDDGLTISQDATSEFIKVRIYLETNATSRGNYCLLVDGELRASGECGYRSGSEGQALFGKPATASTNSDKIYFKSVYVWDATGQKYTYYEEEVDFEPILEVDGRTRLITNDSGDMTVDENIVIPITAWDVEYDCTVLPTAATPTWNDTGTVAATVYQNNELQMGALGLTRYHRNITETEEDAYAIHVRFNIRVDESLTSISNSFVLDISSAIDTTINKLRFKAYVAITATGLYDRYHSSSPILTHDFTAKTTVDVVKYFSHTDIYINGTYEASIELTETQYSGSNADGALLFVTFPLTGNYPVYLGNLYYHVQTAVENKAVVVCDVHGSNLSIKDIQSRPYESSTVKHLTPIVYSDVSYKALTLPTAATPVWTANGSADTYATVNNGFLEISGASGQTPYYSISTALDTKPFWFSTVVRNDHIDTYLACCIYIITPLSGFRIDIRPYDINCFNLTDSTVLLTTTKSALNYRGIQLLVDPGISKSYMWVDGIYIGEVVMEAGYSNAAQFYFGKVSSVADNSTQYWNTIAITEADPNIISHSKGDVVVIGTETNLGSVSSYSDIIDNSNFLPLEEVDFTLPYPTSKIGSPTRQIIKHYAVGTKLKNDVTYQHDAVAFDYLTATDILNITKEPVVLCEFMSDAELEVIDFDNAYEYLKQGITNTVVNKSYSSISDGLRKNVLLTPVTDSNDIVSKIGVLKQGLNLDLSEYETVSTDYKITDNADRGSAIELILDETKNFDMGSFVEWDKANRITGAVINSGILSNVTEVGVMTHARSENKTLVIDGCAADSCYFKMFDTVTSGQSQVISTKVKCNSASKVFTIVNSVSGSGYKLVIVYDNKIEIYGVDTYVTTVSIDADLFHEIDIVVSDNGWFEVRVDGTIAVNGYDLLPDLSQTYTLFGKGWYSITNSDAFYVKYFDTKIIDSFHGNYDYDSQVDGINLPCVLPNRTQAYLNMAAEPTTLLSPLTWDVGIYQSATKWTFSSNVAYAAKNLTSTNTSIPYAFTYLWGTGQDVADEKIITIKAKIRHEDDVDGTTILDTELYGYLAIVHKEKFYFTVEFGPRRISVFNKTTQEFTTTDYILYEEYKEITLVKDGLVGIVNLDGIEICRIDLTSGTSSDCPTQFNQLAGALTPKTYVVWGSKTDHATSTAKIYFKEVSSGLDLHYGWDLEYSASSGLKPTAEDNVWTLTGVDHSSVANNLIAIDPSAGNGTDTCYFRRGIDLTNADSVWIEWALWIFAGVTTQANIYIKCDALSSASYVWAYITTYNGNIVVSDGVSTVSFSIDLSVCNRFRIIITASGWDLWNGNTYLGSGSLSSGGSETAIFFGKITTADLEDPQYWEYIRYGVVDRSINKLVITNENPTYSLINSDAARYKSLAIIEDIPDGKRNYTTTYDGKAPIAQSGWTLTGVDHSTVLDDGIRISSCGTDISTYTKTISSSAKEAWLCFNIKTSASLTEPIHVLCGLPDGSSGSLSFDLRMNGSIIEMHDGSAYINLRSATAGTIVNILARLRRNEFILWIDGIEYLRWKPVSGGTVDEVTFGKTTTVSENNISEFYNIRLLSNDTYTDYDGSAICFRTPQHGSQEVYFELDNCDDTLNWDSKSQMFLCEYDLMFASQPSSTSSKFGLKLWFGQSYAAVLASNQTVKLINSDDTVMNGNSTTAHLMSDRFMRISTRISDNRCAAWIKDPEDTFDNFITDSNTYTYQYEADVLPQYKGWLLFGTDCGLINGGILELVSCGTATNNYLYYLNESSKELWLETRVKVAADSTTPLSFIVNMEIGGSTDSLWVSIYSDSRITFGYGSAEETIWTGDTTTFFKMLIKANADELSILIDDKLIFTTVPRNGSILNYFNYVLFGKFSTDNDTYTKYIDYVVLREGPPQLEGLCSTVDNQYKLQFGNFGTVCPVYVRNFRWKVVDKVRSLYEENVDHNTGWHDVDFNLSTPDSTIGSPTREAITNISTAVRCNRDNLDIANLVVADTVFDGSATLPLTGVTYQNTDLGDGLVGTQSSASGEWILSGWKRDYAFGGMYCTTSPWVKATVRVESGFNTYSCGLHIWTTNFAIVILIKDGSIQIRNYDGINNVYPYKTTDKITIVAHINSVGKYAVWIDDALLEIGKAITQIGSAAIKFGKFTHSEYEIKSQYWDDVAYAATVDDLFGFNVEFDNVVANYAPERYAKCTYVAGDGTKIWEPRVKSFDKIARSMTEFLGDYETSECNVTFLNYDAHFSKLYSLKGYKLFNKSFKILYGDNETIYKNFNTLYSGNISNIKTQHLDFVTDTTDAIHKSLDLIPNRRIFEDDFPNAPEASLNEVMPIIGGTVTDTFGCIPMVPIDFSVTIELNNNDEIPFRTVEDEASGKEYLAKIVPGEYNSPTELATAVKTALDSATDVITPGPGPGLVFNVLFDADGRKFNIYRNIGRYLKFVWSTTPSPHCDRVAGETLGYDTTSDTMGSYEHKSARLAWNVFVVAGHPCKDDSNAAIFMRDKDDNWTEITTAEFTFNDKRWTDYPITTVRLPFHASDITDIRCNISGLTDDLTDSGTIITNPVEFLQSILINVLGIPVSHFNVPQIEIAKRIAAARNYIVAGATVQETDWDMFIAEFCKSFSMDFWEDKESLINFDFFQNEINDKDAMSISDHYNILDHSISVSPNFEYIVNNIKVEFNYNHFDDKFGRSRVLTNDQSIKDIGATRNWPEGTLQLKWVRNSTVAERVGNTNLDIYASADPSIDLTVTDIIWDKDIADKVRLTHYAGLAYSYDPVEGVERGGYRDRLCRIKSIDHDVDSYKSFITLQDYDRLTKNKFFLGDREWSSADKVYVTATSTKQVKYGYLADRLTGEFSDNTPGKQL